MDLFGGELIGDVWGGGRKNGLLRGEFPTGINRERVLASQTQEQGLPAVQSGIIVPRICSVVSGHGILPSLLIWWHLFILEE